MKKNIKKIKILRHRIRLLFLAIISILLFNVVNAQTFVAKPATFVSADKTAEVGMMNYLLDGEGKTGNVVDGKGPGDFYWLRKDNPVTFYINMNSSSKISAMKFYLPWGWNEGAKNITIRFYNSSTLLGTENLVLPYQYARPYYLKALTKAYLNVTKVQFVVVDDWLGSTVSPNPRTSLQEIVFGDLVCNAGTTAPPVKDITNICPSASVNLNDAHTGTIPSGTSLVWYTNNTHTGTALTGTQVTQVTSNGTYYAFYYDSVNKCYSPSSNAVIVAINSTDSDGDGILDMCDLDNDNDGIKDIDENCSGFLAQNTSGVWKGKTASNLTATLTGATTQTNTHAFSDGQIRYYVNQNGGDPRYYKTGSISFTYSFSNPVPAKEIAFLVDDIDPSNGSTNVTVSFKINGGAPNGNFIAIDYGQNPLTYLNYNSITGLMSSSNSGLDDQRLIIKGVGDILVSSITITNSGIASGDGVAYSLFASNPCDTDGDGIPNVYDLDSDGDGCVDAIEGDGNFKSSQLTSASGTLSSQSPNQNFGTVVDINGIPTLVGAAGQAIGESQDANKNDCIDSDSDGYPDWQDLDDDNDGILDTIENCIDNTILTLDRNNISGTSTFSIVGGDNDVTPVTAGYPYWVGQGSQDESIQYTFTNPAYAIQIPQVININGNTTTDSELLEIYINGTLYPITASMVTGLSTNSFISSGGSIGSTTMLAVTNFTAINIDYPAGIKNIRIRNNPGTAGGNGWEMNGLKVLSRSTCNTDVDGDGILNSLDLDSDNDGCPDAIEGGANFTTSDLVSSDMQGGNSGATSGTYNQPVIQNLGNTVGNTATTMGVPTIAGTGQAIGDSQNSSINNQCSFPCYIPAQTTGVTLDTNHGITALGRAGVDNSNWPMVRKGSWTALEAKTKGFVVNRIPTTAAVNTIANPVEGMMVYDEEADCLKIYTTTDGTNFSWKCFNTPACPN